MASQTPDDRDGFVITAMDDGREIHFVPCSYGGSMRDRVERGLLVTTDERFIVRDTRWSDDT